MDDKLGGITDAGEDQTIKYDLEDWDDRKVRKYNRMKCKVMFLGTNSNNFCYKLQSPECINQSWGDKEPWM